MFHSKRTDLAIQQVDGETVLLDEQDGVVHQLNPTATFIWLQCDGKSTTEEIARRLVEAFDVDNDVASKDVSAVLSKLSELNLLAE